MASIGKAIQGLPPKAVLAGSHGGRLVASGIIISGDRGGGGFDVKAARTAARTTLRQMALAQELAMEEERSKARRSRAGPTTSMKESLGLRRRRRGNLPSRQHGDGSASLWGWRHQRNDRQPASAFGRTSPSRNRVASAGSAAKEGYSNCGDSLAPSFEGSARHSGSGGSVGGGKGVGTDASGSVGITSKQVVAVPGTATAQHLRGLNEDSVVWASSRRGSSRSSSCSRTRRRQNKGGEGQVETIQRLVHMGLF